MALSLRDDCDAVQLKLAARRSDNADQVRRLLTLAAIYDGVSRAEAARTGGVTRQSCETGWSGSTRVVPTR